MELSYPWDLDCWSNAVLGAYETFLRVKWLNRLVVVIFELYGLKVLVAFRMAAKIDFQYQCPKAGKD